jgi:hypothetical protein
MYKLMVLVGFPIYTIATVLFTLLLAAGIGSRMSTWIFARVGRRVVWLFPLIALLVVGLVAGFPHARDVTLGMGQWARMAFAGALLFPLGICLGMPFPIGITALQRSVPYLIPWAWGVNGFMTVVGSLVAAVSSMSLGFDRTLLLAAGTYLVAMLVLPALLARGNGPRGEP